MLAVAMPARYARMARNDTSDLKNELHLIDVRPHVARRLRGSAIDRCTKHHLGYGTSQRIRRRIEEASGKMKMIGGMLRPIGEAPSASDGPSDLRAPKNEFVFDHDENETHP